jgi:hypothetical protein
MCGSAAPVSAWRGGAEIIVKGCDFRLLLKSDIRSLRPKAAGPGFLRALVLTPHSDRSRRRGRCRSACTGLLARGGKVVGAELLGGNFPSPPPSDRKGAVTRYKRPDSHGMSGAADRRAQELWQICHMS